MIVFFTLFRYFINLFYSFHCHSFPFLKGCRLEKGHIGARSVFLFLKKKKKKKKNPKFLLVIKKKEKKNVSINLMHCLGLSLHS